MTKINTRPKTRAKLIEAAAQLIRRGTDVVVVCADLRACGGVLDQMADRLPQGLAKPGPLRFEMPLCTLWVTPRAVAFHQLTGRRGRALIDPGAFDDPHPKDDAVRDLVAGFNAAQDAREAARLEAIEKAETAAAKQRARDRRRRDQ